MINSQLYKHDIINFCNTNQTNRYRLWVYECIDTIQVFQKQLPNTEQIWFDLYSFSHFYWKLMQQECVFEVKNNLFYNYQKMKLFIINYLIFDTNLPGVFIERKKDGKLTEESFKSIITVHPRILRVLFDMINVFPYSFNDQQQKQIEKQCHKLFGKGQSVANPHPSIVRYCNLISFWDKFGMNYYDIMKLPNEIFVELKKIMSLDNEYKSASLNKQTPPKKVGF